MSEKSPRFTFLALPMVALSILIVIYEIFLMPRDTEISRVQFPDKTQVVTYLPDASSEQSLKIIRFDADGYTRLDGTIYWKSGLIEDLKYRRDNTVASSLEYYAKNNGDGWNTRVQKCSESTFAADGLTYRTHKVYRRDGTLERTGEQLSATYLSIYYFADGKTVQRERTFDHKHRYRSEKIFREDGSILATIFSETSKPTETATTLYRPDGTMSAMFTKHPINGEHGEVFADDGSTVLVEYQRDYYNVQEIFRDAKGNLLQERDGSRMGGLLTVRHYRHSDQKMDYRQRWLLRYTVGPEADNLTLRRVEYYDFTNNRACEISMTPAGDIISTVTCPEANGGSSIKILDSDGKTVKSIQHKTKSGTTKVETPRGLTVTFDPAWFENRRPMSLPNFEDVGAPPPVYDYH